MKLTLKLLKEMIQAEITNLQVYDVIERVRKTMAHDIVVRNLGPDNRKDRARVSFEWALKSAVESMYLKQVDFQHDQIPWEKIHQTVSEIKYSEDWKMFFEEYWQVGVFHDMAKKGKLPGRLNDMATSTPEEFLHAYELALSNMLLPETE